MYQDTSLLYYEIYLGCKKYYATRSTYFINIFTSVTWRGAQ